MCSLLNFLTGRHHRTKNRSESPGHTQKSLNGLIRHTRSKINQVFLMFPPDWGACDVNKLIWKACIGLRKLSPLDKLCRNGKLLPCWRCKLSILYTHFTRFFRSLYATLDDSSVDFSKYSKHKSLFLLFLFYLPNFNTVIHLFMCVYECYNNVHDNSEQELSGNPNGLIEESW